MALSTEIMLGALPICTRCSGEQAGSCSVWYCTVLACSCLHETKTIYLCLCHMHLGTVMSSSVCSSQFFVIVGRGHHGCRFYFMRVGLFLFVEWSMPGRWVARMMCWNHCRSYHLVVIPGLWKFGRMHDMPETLNAHLNILINATDPGNW